MKVFRVTGCENDQQRLENIQVQLLSTTGELAFGLNLGMLGTKEEGLSCQT